MDILEELLLRVTAIDGRIYFLDWRAVRAERQSVSVGDIAAPTKVGKLGTRTANGIHRRLASSNGERIVG